MLSTAPERLRAFRGQDPRAGLASVRGFAWTVVIAGDFLLMSNPLVFIGEFPASLDAALLVTACLTLALAPFFRLPIPTLLVTTFLGFALLTSLWSVDPSTSRDAVVMYTLIALVAFTITAHARADTIAAGVTLGGVAMVALSYYALERELVGASVGPSAEGFMAGIGTNRNILAYCLVLAVASTLALHPRSTSGRMAQVAALFVILLGILASESGTGLAAALAVIFAALLLRRQRGRRRLSRTGHQRAVAWSAGGLGIVALFLGTDVLLRMMGRDSSLSGRVPFWKATVSEMEGHLAQGYGWGVVWPHPWQPAPPNNVFDRIWFSASYQLTHGHNSWIDLLPQVGLVGIVLMLLIMVVSARRAVLMMRRDSVTPEELIGARFIGLTLIALLVFGITEPMSTIPVGWFILVLAADLGTPKPLLGRVWAKMGSWQRTS